MKLTSIREIQGKGLFSELDRDRREVRTQGIVTGVQRRGFFIQTPDVTWDGERSDAIFVYSRDFLASAKNNFLPNLGQLVEVGGEVVDYLKHDTAKPVTQIRLDTMRVKQREGPVIEPITVTRELLDKSNEELAILLNSLAAMLLRIPAGQTFIAPSNSHGDYVLSLDTETMSLNDQELRNEHGGVIVSRQNPQRWYPGFRITRYHRAPRLNVGAKLLNDVIGPLNYRADSYQLAVNQDLKIEHNYISLDKSSLEPEQDNVTVMTLNCFNLDPHIESADRVLNPNQDIDDDWGDGRFHTLAQAIVLQANLPDIVALQEIQDNDGAEITDIVDASETYELLIKAIQQLSDVEYKWVNVDPGLGEDGGQPGGNIRNGFLYNPARIAVPDDAYAFGQEDECFEDSRKPLLVKFQQRGVDKTLVCINLHLASKRHQASIFAPENPGVDAKLSVRVEQARRVHDELKEYIADQTPYYVTGDFNDTEHSLTLDALVGKDSANLVETLPVEQRYDYNHRGKLQVLMHGIVPRDMLDKCQYEIIHGNELIGIKPGEDSNKPSDHAYVIAALKL